MPHLIWHDEHGPPGISVPAIDVLIAACARHPQVELEHSDPGFPKLDEV
jgi:hypothetical protein